MKHSSRKVEQQRRRRQSVFSYSSRSAANERHPTRNEDSILVDELTGLVAVFDGVGGSAAAEIASQTGVRAALESWRSVLMQDRQRRKIYTRLQKCEQFDLCKILEELILEADEQVRTDGAQRAGTDDLATTVALAAFCQPTESRNYTMVYAHVGDSRIYLLRRQETLRRLTSDDGLLTKLIENQILNEAHALRIDQAMRANQLTDIDYRYFRLRGGITQALGGPLPPTVHTDTVNVEPGDRILLCTDGIHDNLTDEEIEQIMRSTPRSIVGHALVEQARIRSREDYSQTIRAKPDDMSAVVVTCRF